MIGMCSVSAISVPPKVVSSYEMFKLVVWFAYGIVSSLVFTKATCSKFIIQSPLPLAYLKALIHSISLLYGGLCMKSFQSRCSTITILTRHFTLIEDLKVPQ
jgi:hypothetical protein